MNLPQKNIVQKDENLETLQADASSKRLTVIVSGSDPKNIAFANRLARTLPGEIISEYKGFLREKGKILIVSSLTSMLEQDACIIVKIETVNGAPALLISKNRTGKTGYIGPRIPSP